jgi:hypothetical protein
VSMSVVFCILVCDKFNSCAFLSTHGDFLQNKRNRKKVVAPWCCNPLSLILILRVVCYTTLY